MSFKDSFNTFVTGTSNLFSTVSSGIVDVSEAVDGVELPVVQTKVGLDNKTMLYGLLALGIVVVVYLFKKKKR